MVITSPSSSSSSSNSNSNNFHSSCPCPSPPNNFQKFIGCLNGSYNINIGKILFIFLFVYFILNFFF